MGKPANVDSRMKQLKDFYKNKRVVVTGHTGFKGAWLSEMLLYCGAEVTGYSCDIPTSPSLFTLLGLAKRLQKDVRADVENFQEFSQCLMDSRPDVVFHLAAQPLVRQSYELPLRTFSSNVMGTANVLEATRHCSSVQSLVVITTDKVYENQEWNFSYRENDRLGGADPYSASKAAAEIVFHSYVKSFFKTSTTRVYSARAGNVIGGGDWAQDRLIPDAIRALENKSTLGIRNPQSVRPWQHVLEPLVGYMSMALPAAQKYTGESFNFGPRLEDHLTVESLLNSLQKHLPVKWDHQPAKDGKKEAQLLKLNCDKAQEFLAWAPQLSAGQAIAWTGEWYKSYMEKSDMLKFTQKQIESYFSRKGIS